MDIAERLREQINAEEKAREAYIAEANMMAAKMYGRIEALKSTLAMIEGDVREDAPNA